MHEYESAISTAEKALRFRARHFAARVVKTASLAQTGDLTAARLCLKEIDDISVVRLTKQWPFRTTDALGHILDGLRRAGLPE
jgi:hypothetical protein